MMPVRLRLGSYLVQRLRIAFQRVAQGVLENVELGHPGIVVRCCGGGGLHRQVDADTHVNAAARCNGVASQLVTASTSLPALGVRLHA